MARGLSREITSEDVRFAFERIGTEAVVAQYGFYYDVIEGMKEFKEGKADTISGIETPDDKTVIFKLTQPTGDFSYRLAMPAAGPQPKEVAGCFMDEANLYGRYLVSAGPYMIEGADAQDATSCDTLKQLSGFDPNSFLILVRNPDYDPATDSPEAREALPDSFEFRINTNVDDIYAKVMNGDIEDEVASEPPRVVREYTTNEDLKQHYHLNSGDRTWYIYLNLTQPPFDDINVRKAVNLGDGQGGAAARVGRRDRGDIATHIVPNAMLNDALADYDPYPSEGFAGDVEAAKEFMKQSKYDTDKDGICDAPECKDVLYLTATDRLRQDMVPPTQASLEQIGITLQVRASRGRVHPDPDREREHPDLRAGGLGQGLPGRVDVHGAVRLAQHHPDRQRNYSLIGATCEQLQRSTAGRATARVSRAWMRTSTRAAPSRATSE